MATKVYSNPNSIKDQNYRTLEKQKSRSGLQQNSIDNLKQAPSKITGPNIEQIANFQNPKQSHLFQNNSYSNISYYPDNNTEINNINNLHSPSKILHDNTLPDINRKYVGSMSVGNSPINPNSYPSQINFQSNHLNGHGSYNNIPDQPVYNQFAATAPAGLSVPPSGSKFTPRRKNTTTNMIASTSPMTPIISPPSSSGAGAVVTTPYRIRKLEEIDSRRYEIGLENLGNTCFMNSTLQCLLHIKPLISYFLDGNLEKDLNYASPKKGMLASSFYHLVQEIYNGQSHNAIAPINFQRAVGVFAPYLMDFQQQDSQEFLRFLLDGMSEDLCRRKTGLASTQPLSINTSQIPNQTSETPLSSQSKQSGKLIPVLPHLNTANLSPNNTSNQPNSHRSQNGIPRTEIPDTPTSTDPEMFPKLRVIKDVIESRKSQDDPLQNSAREDSQLNQEREEDDGSDRSKASTPAPIGRASSFSNQLKDVFGVGKIRIRRPKGSSSSSNQVTGQSPPSTARVSNNDGEPLSYRSSADDSGLENKNRSMESVPSTPNANFHQSLLDPHKEAKLAWERYLKWNDSVITDIFGGLLQSTIVCLTCKSKSYSFDPFLDLSVPISRDNEQTPSRSFLGTLRNATASMTSSSPTAANAGTSSISSAQSSLEKCLEKFTAEEILDGDNMYHCERCKKKRKGMKRLSIYRYPQVLIIQIKRFRFNSTSREKLSTDVHFPMNGLSLQTYLSQDLATLDKEKYSNNNNFENTNIPLNSSPFLSPSSPPVYDLVGVSNHFGNLNGGHYIAHVDTSFGSDSKWVCFNDARVSIANPVNIVGPTAYVLFYKLRQDLNDLNSIPSPHQSNNQTNCDDRIITSNLQTITLQPNDISSNSCNQNLPNNNNPYENLHSTISTPMKSQHRNQEL